MIKRWSRGVSWIVGLIASIAAAVSSPEGQTSVWNGVYVESQATAGEKVYADSCAKCHGQDLAGIERAPALAGLTSLNGGTAPR